MTNIEVHLDSNIMQQPHVFRQISRGYEGLARDLMIYAALDRSEWKCVLRVGDFCKLFGYNRQHVLKKLTEKQKKALEHEGLTDIQNVLEFVLLRLSTRSLTFEEKYSQVNPEGSIEKVTKFNGIAPIIGDLTFTRSKRGNTYSFQVQDFYKRACRARYQSFFLSHYLNVTTETGQAWNYGRALFLRLVWKRQNFAGKGEYKDGEDNYHKLCKAAGLTHDCEKRKAYELREMIREVNELGSVGMEATIRYREELAKVPYEVIFKKVKQVGKQLALELSEK